MNKTEVAQLLTIASMIDNRTVAPETVEAWHEVIGKQDYELARQAMTLHWQETTEYLLPNHILNNIRRVRTKIATDVRSARARGIVPDHWPESRMLMVEQEQKLTDAREQGGWWPRGTSGRSIMPPIKPDPDAWMNE